MDGQASAWPQDDQDYEDDNGLYIDGNDDNDDDDDDDEEEEEDVATFQ